MRRRVADIGGHCFGLYGQSNGLPVLATPCKCPGDTRQLVCLQALIGGRAGHLRGLGSSSGLLVLEGPASALAICARTSGCLVGPVMEAATAAACLATFPASRCWAAFGRIPAYRA